MKTEFVSTVSHELRTPLTSIRGSLGLLAGGVFGTLPPNSDQMLTIAVNNTDRLIRLINDILDIERLESGHVGLSRRVCDLSELLDQALAGIRGMADQTGIRLEVSATRARLNADPDRVIQTLTNLLGNAIKFSPPGSTVWLRVARVNDDLLFTIRDQGRGIPRDKVVSIFERFSQVNASDARKQDGTGLGLAICRSIVQQHGGRIWAESDGEGQGSSFFFTLPALDSEIEEPEMDDREGLVATTSGRPEELPRTGRGVVMSTKRILLIDDEDDIREVVRLSLELVGGWTVALAASARQGLARPPTNHPDAILLDVMMSGMDGPATFKALQQRPGNVATFP